MFKLIAWHYFGFQGVVHSLNDNNYKLLKMRKASYLRLHQSFIWALLFYSFFIYPVVSTTIFNYFNYIVIAEPTLEPLCYLVKDFTTSCVGTMGDGELNMYEGWAIYAIVMIFVYPIGIPCMYLLIMFRHRQEIDPIIRELGHTGRMDGPHDEAVILADDERKETQNIKHISFLWAPYQPRFWWWEGEL